MGIDGVTVELWSNQPNATTAVSTTTTFGGGLYKSLNVAPGGYYVRVPTTNFAEGGALANRVPSKSITAGSGIITTTAGDDDAAQDGYTSGSVLVAGVRTALFTVLPANAPTALTNETGYLSETDDFADADVDLTVDLGFCRNP